MRKDTMTLQEFVDLINSITALDSESEKIVMKNTERLEQLNTPLRIKNSPFATIQISTPEAEAKALEKLAKETKVPIYAFKLVPDNILRTMCYIVDVQNNIVACAESIDAKVTTTFYKKAKAYSIINSNELEKDLRAEELLYPYKRFIVFDSLESMLGL